MLAPSPASHLTTLGSAHCEGRAHCACTIPLLRDPYQPKGLGANHSSQGRPRVKKKLQKCLQQDQSRSGDAAEDLATYNSMLV